MLVISWVCAERSIVPSPDLSADGLLGSIIDFRCQADLLSQSCFPKRSEWFLGCSFGAQRFTIWHIFLPSHLIKNGKFSTWVVCVSRPCESSKLSYVNHQSTILQFLAHFEAKINHYCYKIGQTAEFPIKLCFFLITNIGGAVSLEKNPPKTVSLNFFYKKRHICC